MKHYEKWHLSGGIEHFAYRAKHNTLTMRCHQPLMESVTVHPTVLLK